MSQMLPRLQEGSSSMGRGVKATQPGALTVRPPMAPRLLGLTVVQGHKMIQKYRVTPPVAITLTYSLLVGVPRWL